MTRICFLFITLFLLLAYLRPTFCTDFTGLEVANGNIRREDIDWGTAEFPGSFSVSTYHGARIALTTMAGMIKDAGIDTSGDIKVDSPWVDGRAYASVNAAVTAIGSTPATLLIPTAHTLTGDITFPPTLSLVIPKDGIIVKSSTYRVTINGPFFAGRYQVFSGFSSGNVTFGSGSQNSVYPEWWGNNTSPGMTDMISMLHCAVASLPPRGGEINLDGVDYFISSAWNITKSSDWSANVCISGKGKASRLRMNTDSSMLVISNTGRPGRSNTRRITVRDLGFYQAGATTANVISLINSCYNQFNNIDIVGNGTAVYVDSHSDYNEFDNVIITHMDRGCVIAGNKNQVNNLVIAEEITGADAINISGTGNSVSNFAIEASGGTGGNAAVDITGDSTALVNGFIVNSYANGIRISASGVLARNITIMQPAKHGIYLDSGGRHNIQAYISGANFGRGNYDNVHVYQSKYNILNLQFQSSQVIYDINEDSGSDQNLYIVADLPNGTSLNGKNHQLISPRGFGTDIVPLIDNTYYLGKSDRDSPTAWRGLILKDTTNGKYYRIEVINGEITATVLKD